MGSGAWTTSCYVDSLVDRGFSKKAVADASTRFATMDCMSTDQVYTCRELHPDLDPHGVVRECCDSEEHPNTVPVIFALDVTGSMGPTARACAAQINEIITSLNKDYPDVQFMTMGIGDFAYDDAPLQVSQFESDVRICDQLGKIWFERGGGGNSFESYTAAWYFALNHTQLDCWNRGKKGIIITMGDEPLNPYLPGRAFNRIFGYSSQDIDTVDLYEQVSEKYDIYHIIITDRESCGWRFLDRDKESWGKVLDGQHLFVKESNDLPEVIHDIVVSHVDDATNTYTENVNTVIITEEGIAW